METMQPRPAGLEAPEVLPSAPAAVSAEASGLGGTYSVTLIATPTEEPVNSPQLASAAGNPASDLGTFSTIASTSTADASRFLRSSRAQDIATCAGPSTPVRLGGTVAATACPSAQGPVLNWDVGAWKVQVQRVGGSKDANAQATILARWLATHALPAAADGGLVSVSVPGTPEAGSSVSSIVLWDHGANVYQTSAPGNELAALDLAISLKPWPATT
jgi:hypothetical protein